MSKPTSRLVLTSLKETTTSQLVLLALINLDYDLRTLERAEEDGPEAMRAAEEARGAYGTLQEQFEDRARGQMTPAQLNRWEAACEDFECGKPSPADVRALALEILREART